MTFVVTPEGDEVSKLVVFEDETFYTDQLFAILGEDNTVKYTVLTTDAAANPGGNLTWTQPPEYHNGWSRAAVQSRVRQPFTLGDALNEDLTISAYGSKDGRRPSATVRARIQFKVATPQLRGDNPYSFEVLDSTPNARLTCWFSVKEDDKEPDANPRTDGRTYQTGDRVETPPDVIAEAINRSAKVHIEVRGARQYWQGSDPMTTDLSPTTYSANDISLGFAHDGEGASAFVGAPGQRFFAPVTLNLLDGQTIYSLMFNAQAVGLPDSGGVLPPLVEPNSLSFVSTLWKPEVGVSPPRFERIPPALSLGYSVTNVIAQPVTNLVAVQTPQGTEYVTVWETNYIFRSDFTNMVVVNPNGPQRATYGGMVRTSARGRPLQYRPARSHPVLHGPQQHVRRPRGKRHPGRLLLQGSPRRGWREPIPSPDRPTLGNLGRGRQRRLHSSPPSESRCGQRT